MLRRFTHIGNAQKRTFNNTLLALLEGLRHCATNTGSSCDAVHELQPNAQQEQQPHHNLMSFAFADEFVMPVASVDDNNNDAATTSVMQTENNQQQLTQQQQQQNVFHSAPRGLRLTIDHDGSLSGGNNDNTVPCPPPISSKTGKRMLFVHLDDVQHSGVVRPMSPGTRIYRDRQLHHEALDIVAMGGKYFLPRAESKASASTTTTTNNNNNNPQQQHQEEHRNYYRYDNNNNDAAGLIVRRRLTFIINDYQRDSIVSWFTAGVLPRRATAVRRRWWTLGGRHQLRVQPRFTEHSFLLHFLRETSFIDGVSPQDCQLDLRLLGGVPKHDSGGGAEQQQQLEYANRIQQSWLFPHAALPLIEAFAFWRKTELQRRAMHEPGAEIARAAKREQQHQEQQEQQQNSSGDEQTNHNSNNNKNHPQASYRKGQRTFLMRVGTHGDRVAFKTGLPQEVTDAPLPPPSPLQDPLTHALEPLLLLGGRFESNMNGSDSNSSGGGFWSFPNTQFSTLVYHRKLLCCNNNGADANDGPTWRERIDLEREAALKLVGRAHIRPKILPPAESVMVTSKFIRGTVALPFLPADVMEISADGEANDDNFTLRFKTVEQVKITLSEQLEQQQQKQQPQTAAAVDPELLSNEFALRARLQLFAERIPLTLDCLGGEHQQQQQQEDDEQQEPRHQQQSEWRFSAASRPLVDEWLNNCRWAIAPIADCIRLRDNSHSSTAKSMLLTSTDRRLITLNTGTVRDLVALGGSFTSSNRFSGVLCAWLFPRSQQQQQQEKQQQNGNEITTTSAKEAIQAWIDAGASGALTDAAARSRDMIERRILSDGVRNVETTTKTTNSINDDDAVKAATTTAEEEERLVVTVTTTFPELVERVLGRQLGGHLVAQSTRPVQVRQMAMRETTYKYAFTSDNRVVAEAFFGVPAWKRYGIFTNKERKEQQQQQSDNNNANLIPTVAEAFRLPVASNNVSSDKDEKVTTTATTSIRPHVRLIVGDNVAELRALKNYSVLVSAAACEKNGNNSEAGDDACLLKHWKALLRVGARFKVINKQHGSSGLLAGWVVPISRWNNLLQGWALRQQQQQSTLPTEATTLQEDRKIYRIPLTERVTTPVNEIQIASSRPFFTFTHIADITERLLLSHAAGNNNNKNNTATPPRRVNRNVCIGDIVEELPLRCDQSGGEYFVISMRSVDEICRVLGLAPFGSSDPAVLSPSDEAMHWMLWQRCFNTAFLRLGAALSCTQTGSSAHEWVFPKCCKPLVSEYLQCSWVLESN